MSSIDPVALRDAVDMFLDAGGTAPLGRVTAAYKVLTPGRPGHRVSAEDAEGLGYAVVRDGGGGLRLRLPDGAAPGRAAPGDDECFDLALDHRARERLDERDGMFRRSGLAHMARS